MDTLKNFYRADLILVFIIPSLPFKMESGVNNSCELQLFGKMVAQQLIGKSYAKQVSFT